MAGAGGLLSTLPATPPPWPGLSSDDALPERADVAVIGAGLAGLAAAVHLAEGGAEVVVLESRPTVGTGADGRGPGLARIGVDDHLHRIVAGLGRAHAEAIARFSREALDALEALGALRRVGLIHGALDAHETADRRADADAFTALGCPARFEESSLFVDLLPSTLTIDAEGPFESEVAFGALAARLRRAAGRLVTGATVLGQGQDEDGAALVQVGRQELRAEATVLAAGAGSRTLDPWLADKIVPVREQAIRVERADPLPPMMLGRDSIQVCPVPGGVVVAGCRWAAKDLGEGLTDDTVVVARVEDRLRAVLERLGGGGPVTHRWSWIRTATCDGLPVVGPMPGDPRRVICAGFGSNGPGLALRAGRAVAEGLLTGHAAGVPASFLPTRFL